MTVSFLSKKLESPMLAGEVLFCGGTNWDLVGRRTLPKGGKDWFMLPCTFLCL